MSAKLGFAVLEFTILLFTAIGFDSTRRLACLYDLLIAGGLIEFNCMGLVCKN